MKNAIWNGVTKFGELYNRGWSFLLRPIVKPLTKKIGDTKDWSRKNVVKVLLIGLVCGKVGIWALLLIPLWLNETSLWSFWIWLPAMMGYNLILIMAITGWETVWELQGKQT